MSSQTTSWRDRALCREADNPDLFYPTVSSGIVAQIHIQTALAWCERCPVTEACLRQAMREEGSRAARDRYGIRGGSTPDERRAEYERRKRANSRATARALQLETAA